MHNLVLNMSFSFVINIAQAAPWWLWPSLLHVYMIVHCVLLSSSWWQLPLRSVQAMCTNKRKRCHLFILYEYKFGVNVFLMFISIINLLVAAKRSVVCMHIIIHPVRFGHLFYFALFAFSSHCQCDFFYFTHSMILRIYSYISPKIDDWMRILFRRILPPNYHIFQCLLDSLLICFNWKKLFSLKSN